MKHMIADSVVEIIGVKQQETIEEAVERKVSSSIRSINSISCWGKKGRSSIRTIGNVLRGLK